MLWTRVTTQSPDRAVDVSWTMGLDPELADVVATGTAIADPERDHTVHVDVADLDPATTYYYRFAALDEVSTVGRTRTLPGPGLEHLRFAMASCARLNVGFFNGYARIAERDDIDFLLHLGDYIYEGSNEQFPNDPVPDLGRSFDPDRNCVTLDDYRRRHAEYCGDPDVRAVRAAHPTIATVDDHDFADGCWRDGASWHKPADDGPWADRRAAAFRARWEWLPARQPDPADPERVFRTVHIGGLADLVLTDIRTRRDEPVARPASLADERTNLGTAQREWLFGELDASTATWRLLANSSVMGQTWAEHLPESVRPSLAMLKLLGDDGAGPDPDQWDGYPAERERLMRHVRDHDMRNVVVLSGDVHVAIALELHVDAFDGSDPVAVEFVTASLTSANLDEKMGWPRRTKSLEIERESVEALGHWKWCDLDDHGYVVIDVTPERVVAEWRFVPTVLERVPGEEAGGRWMVEQGSPRVLAVP